MYCIISERQLRQSNYRGKYWRGALLNIKTTHTEQMPFIAFAIPSEAFSGSLELARLVAYLNYCNRERHSEDEGKSFMLVKAMGTPNGVTYQIVARGGAGITRDDGEFPQRRMTLMPSERENDPRRSYFNPPTRTILSTRAAPTAPDFDALSMFYTNNNLMFNSAELNKFKRAMGSHWEARDMERLRSLIEQRYQ